MYDARHALSGVGRVVWPILGPLLAMAILFPVVVLVAWLWNLAGLQTPRIDMPSIDLPEIALPNVGVPGWLRAIGDILGAAFSLLGAVGKYVVLAGAVFFGVRRTQAVRRQRRSAEEIGRAELERRMAVALTLVEARARAHAASTIGDASLEHARPDDRSSRQCG